MPNSVYVDDKQFVVVKNRYAYHYTRPAGVFIGRGDLESRVSYINLLYDCGLQRWHWDYVGFPQYYAEVRKVLQNVDKPFIRMELVTEAVVREYYNRTVEPNNAAYDIATHGC